MIHDIFYTMIKGALSTKYPNAYYNAAYSKRGSAVSAVINKFFPKESAAYKSGLQPAIPDSPSRGLFAEPGLHLIYATRNSGKTFLMNKFTELCDVNQEPFAVLTASEKGSEVSMFSDIHEFICAVIGKIITRQEKSRDVLRSMLLDIARLHSPHPDDTNKDDSTSDSAYLAILAEYNWLYRVVDMNDARSLEKLAVFIADIIGNSPADNLVFVDSMSSIIAAKQFNAGSYMTGGQSLQASEWWGYISHILEGLTITVIASYSPRAYTGTLPDFVGTLSSFTLLDPAPFGSIKSLSDIKFRLISANLLVLNEEDGKSYLPRYHRYENWTFQVSAQSSAGAPQGYSSVFGQNAENQADVIQSLQDNFQPII